jgi:hypothetical protein
MHSLPWHQKVHPWEKNPSTHLTGGWVGPRVSLDAVEKRKIPSPCQESNPMNPNHPAHSQSLH